MSKIQNEHILKSVPLLASVLGDRYGVQVVIGGETAMTDGSTIYLPSLALECSDEFIGLLRGFLDHEAAHIRYTCFELLAKSNLTDFEKYVWNCIEDWRIEHKMATHFTGCKVNFHWLINHIFYNQRKRNKKQAIEDTLAEWLLLTIRSWDVEALKPQIDTLEKHINEDCPKLPSNNLLGELGVLLWEVKNKCKSTQDALDYAKEIVACIEKYINLLGQLEKEQDQDGSMENQNTQEIGVPNGEEYEGEESAGNSQDIMSTPSQSHSLQDTKTANDRKAIAVSLRNLLDGDSSSLPSSIGEKVKVLIERGREKNPEQRVRVATVGRKNCKQLEVHAVQNALRISTSLKARLQGLLQAQSLVRYLPASHGKINKNRLHGLAVNETKVFLRHTIKQATNTAIHILLDTSGSMRGKMEVASQACFALASALYNTKGINVGVTAFPALLAPIPLAPVSTPAPRADATSIQPNRMRHIHVYPLVKHGKKVTNNFNLEAEGGTPLSEALWWLMPQLLSQKETRKIVLLITDGQPDQRETAVHAIEYANKIGIEIYGIGIPPCQVDDILPSKSITIEAIEQLPQAMFGLLQAALTTQK